VFCSSFAKNTSHKRHEDVGDTFDLDDQMWNPGYFHKDGVLSVGMFEVSDSLRVA
jgi:hypothetical protein